jgi:hypothetical protein
LTDFGKAFEDLSEDQVVALAESFNPDQATRRTPRSDPLRKGGLNAAVGLEMP